MAKQPSYFVVSVYPHVKFTGIKVQYFTCKTKEGAQKVRAYWEEDETTYSTRISEYQFEDLSGDYT